MLGKNSIHSKTVGTIAPPGAGVSPARHEAIRVGDMVYDSLRPNGIPYAEFHDDIYGLKALIDGVGAKISETVF